MHPYSLVTTGHSLGFKNTAADEAKRKQQLVTSHETSPPPRTASNDSFLKSVASDFYDSQPSSPEVDKLFFSPQDRQFLKGLPDLSGPTLVKFPNQPPFTLPALDSPPVSGHQKPSWNPFAIFEIEPLTDFNAPLSRQLKARKEVQSLTELESEPSILSEASSERVRTGTKKKSGSLSERRKEFAVKRKYVLEDYQQGETKPGKLAKKHDVTSSLVSSWIRKFKHSEK